MSTTSKNMALKITGNGTSVLSDISGQVNSQSLEFAVTMLDDTGMGDTQHGIVAGLAAAPRIPLNGRHNSTIDVIFGNVAQGTSVQKTAEFKAASGIFYNGTVEIESYQVSGSVDTITTWSAVLVGVSGFNRTSVAL